MDEYNRKYKRYTFFKWKYSYDFSLQVYNLSFCMYINIMWQNWIALSTFLFSLYICCVCYIQPNYKNTNGYNKHNEHYTHEK